jgi:hypothetical protein
MTCIFTGHGVSLDKERLQGHFAIMTKRKSGMMTGLQDAIGMAGNIEGGLKAGGVEGRHRVVWSTGQEKMKGMARATDPSTDEVFSFSANSFG